MVTKKLALVAATAVLLAGCGGGGGGSSYDDAASVAKAAGCTNAKQQKKADLEMYVSDAVDCKYNGDDVTVQWFSSSDDLKNWKSTAAQAAKAFGLSGDFPMGKDWALECEISKACEDMAKKIT